MVEKLVSVVEARRELSRMLRAVADRGDRYLVEHDGEPRAVIMSFAAYRRVRTLEEQVRRHEALVGLQRVKDRLGSNNQDLSETDAIQLSDRFVRDVIDEMAVEGTLTFERDRS